MAPRPDEEADARTRRLLEDEPKLRGSLSADAFGPLSAWAAAATDAEPERAEAIRAALEAAVAAAERGRIDDPARLAALAWSSDTDELESALRALELSDVRDRNASRIAALLASDRAHRC